MKINTYDIDGVIFMGKELTGVYPGPFDIIITGRSYEERPETEKMLAERGIDNVVYFNLTKFDDKTREDSGYHKGITIAHLKTVGYEIGIHFEDDPIQAGVIKIIHPELNIVLLQHNLMTMENVRHL
jgi:hypothetical protein